MLHVKHGGVMPGRDAGAADFAALSRRLKDAGETGLRRSLYKAIGDAAKPLAEKIGSDEHLRSYMPSRYAGVLSGDMSVKISRLTGRNPGVNIRAKGRVRDRHVARLNAGILMHPLFGDRERWYAQMLGKGMRPGFFDDPARESAPDVRKAILAAMHETALKVTSGR
jgi:hypothetical protein